MPGEHLIVIQKPATLYATMLVGVSLAMLDIQITNAILPILGSELRASIRDLGSVQTVYLSAEVISIFAIRQIIARYPPTLVFSIASVGFAFASLGCGVSVNLLIFLFFRFLQGIFAGAMVPLASDARFRLFPQSRQPLIGSIVMLALTAAPTFGPSVGAFITQVSSWRMVFILNFPIAVGVAIVVYRRHTEDPSKQKGSDISLASLLYISYFSILFHALLEMVSGDKSGWSDGRLPLVEICIALVILLILEVRESGPIVSIAPLSDLGFLTMVFTTSFITAVHVGLTFIIPLFAQTVGSLSIDEAATVILIGGLAQMLGAPVLWLVIDRVNPAVIIAIGGFLTSLSLWLLTAVSPSWTIYEYALPQVLRGMGFMFIASSTYTLMMSYVSNIYIADATIIISASRNFAAMSAVMLSSTYLDLSQRRMLTDGLITGPGFDRTVGANPEATDSFLRAAAVVGYHNITVLLLIVSFASSSALIAIAWYRTSISNHP